MFEFLRSIINEGENRLEAPNVFVPVSQDDVATAERRMSFKFPDQLQSFFKEVGSGFLQSSSKGGNREDFSYINRFLTPAEIADLYLHEDEHLPVPSEGFKEGALPFFEVGDGLYIVLCPTVEFPNQVTWPFGRPITPDLITFVRRLAANPRFYHA